MDLQKEIDSEVIYESVNWFVSITVCHFPWGGRMRTDQLVTMHQHFQEKRKTTQSMVWSDSWTNVMLWRKLWSIAEMERLTHIRRATEKRGFETASKGPFN